jgi:hypothetical protein
MPVSNTFRPAHPMPVVNQKYTLAVSWPWWVHPGWALLLLTGSMAAVSILLPDSIYETWSVRKFLNPDLSLILAVGILAAFLGIMLSAGTVSRSGSASIELSSKQVIFLRRAYLTMFLLALLSYSIWISSAAGQGVRITDLAAVINRDPGAISSLKDSSHPIGGLTTMTQLAPVVVVLGHVLRKIGASKGRAAALLVVLAAIRTIFYAERLALIEVLIPLLLVAALTVGPKSSWRRLSRTAPLIVAPLIWAVFAISEYTRSWIFYQQTTDLPFTEWVSARLAGYYVTSFNNSAILSIGYEGAHASPYFVFPAFWNAPGAPPHGGIYGLAPDDWWTSMLMTEGNEEFTNPGSFLVTYAELGIWGMMAFWLIVGLILGGLFASMTRGSLPALIGSCAMFVGILELPRFIYWTQGRATPILLALVVVALCYPKTELQKLRSVPQLSAGARNRRP